MATIVADFVHKHKVFYWNFGQIPVVLERASGDYVLINKREVITMTTISIPSVFIVIAAAALVALVVGTMLAALTWVSDRLARAPSRSR